MLKWTPLKTLSLFGTLGLIPWDLFMAMGYKFSGPEHLAALDATFVWATFYLTIPAVLISWVSPKLGAYWILANTAISASIWVVHKISWYLEYRRNPYTLETPIPVGVFLELVSMAVFFWGGKLFFAWGLLYFSGAGTSGNQKSVSGRSIH